MAERGIRRFKLADGSDVQLEMSRDGMRRLLGESWCVDLVSSKAESIKARADAGVGESDAHGTASRVDNKGMARASVWTKSAHAQRAEAKRKNLQNSTY